jgi:hypothetical protein
LLGSLEWAIENSSVIAQHQLGRKLDDDMGFFVPAKLKFKSLASTRVLPRGSNYRSREPSTAPEVHPPLKILHISTRLILGGSQENTVLSCEGQARLGHEVHLAFGPIYGPEGSLLDRVQGFNKRCASGEETTADGRACAPIRTHTIPHLIRELNPRSDRRGLEELKQLIRELEPDIVHTHSSKAGILGRAAACSVFRQAAYQKLVQNSPSGQRVRWHYTPRGIVHTIHGPPFMPLEGSSLQRLKTRAVNKHL